MGDPVTDRRADAEAWLRCGRSSFRHRDWWELPDMPMSARHSAQIDATAWAGIVVRPAARGERVEELQCVAANRHSHSLKPRRSCVPVAPVRHSRLSALPTIVGVRREVASLGCVIPTGTGGRSGAERARATSGTLRDQGPTWPRQAPTDGATRHEGEAVDNAESRTDNAGESLGAVSADASATNRDP